MPLCSPDCRFVEQTGLEFTEIAGPLHPEWVGGAPSLPSQDFEFLIALCLLSRLALPWSMTGTFLLPLHCL